jgi:hypothetical protein
MEMDEDSTDRFTRTWEFRQALGSCLSRNLLSHPHSCLRSRVPRFKPNVANTPLAELHTNWKDPKKGPGMYDTMPLPSPNWKLTSWEERFGPCRHSPTTEGERYVVINVGSGIVSCGNGGAGGRDPGILLIDRS